MSVEAPDRRDPRAGTPGRPASAFLVPATVALLALAVPLFFFGLGSYGLYDPDEPYYAVPAREMLETGTWGVTLLHGRPWLDKPILFYWVVLAAYHVLGVSETAARVGSALAALAGVLAVFWIGRRGRLGERGAFLAALVLAANLEYAIVARAAITDMTLALFVTLGMLGVERYLATGRALPMGLAGAAFGLATLTKGPVGLLLPAVALAAYAALARRSDLLRPRALLAGTAGVALTAAPWYAYMLWAHRDLVIETFIGEGHVDRFVTPEHPSFPFFYAVVILAGFLPWSGALPAALGGAAKPSAWSEERRPGREAGPLYALCWFGAVVAVFQVTASKLLTYVLPAFAPAAMLLGGYWDRTLPGGRSEPVPRHAKVSAWLGLLGGVLSAVTLAINSRDANWADARAGGLPLAAVLLAGTAAGLVAVLRGSLAALAATLASCAAVGMVVVAALALPGHEPSQSARPMVRELERMGVAADVAGIAIARDWYGFDFYLGRSVPRVPGSLLARHVAEQPGKIWIVHTRRRDEILADPATAGTTVLSGRRLSAVRLAPARGGEGRER